MGEATAEEARGAGESSCGTEGHDKAKEEHACEAKNHSRGWAWRPPPVGLTQQPQEKRPVPP